MVKTWLQKNLDDLFGDSMTKKGLKFDLFIMFLIFISSLIFVVETSITSPFFISAIKIIEIVILVIFTVELVLRFYVASSKKEFFLSIYTWIDVLAVLPFWFGFQSQFVRMFRLFRVFRFLRFLNYSKKYVKSHAIEDFTLEKIFFFRLIFTVFMVLFVASALVFQIENNINPTINTFWDAFYFMAISITTVGYGDITPMTNIAQLIVVVTVLLGITIVPAQITSMIKYLAEQKDTKKKECVKCGVSTHQKDAKYCRQCGERL